MSASTPTESASTPIEHDVVIFQLSEKVCAFGLLAVREVVHITALACPPGLPALVEGFLTLGGQIVPAINLRRVFGLPVSPPNLYTPLVILSGETCPIGIMVDEIVDVRSVSDTDVMPMRENRVFNDCVVAEIRLEEYTVHLLDSGKLLLEEERQCLAQLRQTEEDRVGNLMGQGEMHAE